MSETPGKTEVSGRLRGALRLAVVIERFDPDAGGAEKSTAQIIDELVKRGHEVTLIAGSCPDHAKPDGVEVRRYAEKKSSGPLRLLGFSRWAEKQLKASDRERFDASLSITMAVPATVMQPRGGTVRETLDRNVAMRRSAAQRLKKRIEVALDPKQRLLLHLEKRSIRHPRVKAIAAVSHYVVRQFEKHYGLHASRCKVIPNAAVMPDVSPDERAAWRAEMREQHQISDDATVYLFAAQNPALKGIHTLMPAFLSVSHGGRVRSPVLVLVGGDDPNVRRGIADLRLDDAVRVIGPTREMPRWFVAADVTVLPSWYDPASKVVLESLMLGTPAITTAFNGAGDHLEPPGGPVRGRVISDPGDAAALAAAMTDLGDPKIREACSAACTGLAETLSMARHVDALEALLREVALNEPRP